MSFPGRGVWGHPSNHVEINQRCIINNVHDARQLCDKRRRLHRRDRACGRANQECSIIYIEYALREIPAGVQFLATPQAILYSPSAWACTYGECIYSPSVGVHEEIEGDLVSLLCGRG